MENPNNEQLIVDIDYIGPYTIQNTSQMGTTKTISISQNLFLQLNETNLKGKDTNNRLTVNSKK